MASAQKLKLKYMIEKNTNTDFEEEVGLGDLASKKHGKGTKLAAKALLVS